MKRKSGIAAFSVAITIVLSVVSVSRATPILVSPNTTGTRNNIDATIGSEFSVTTTIVVNRLGVWDTGSDGLNTAHDAGIWDATVGAGTLLQSATIPAGTGATLIDGFRYVTIPNVTLVPGQLYRMGAVFLNGGADTFHDQGTADSGLFTTGTGATFAPNNRSVFRSGATLGIPNAVGGGSPGRWAGANVTFIPEPSSLSMLLFGSVMLWLVGRKRTV